MKHILLLILFGFAAAHSRAGSVTDLKSIHKILILGDSITHHSPDSNLGWTGDWGMAATAADKDYVHLFLAKFSEALGGGTSAPKVWIDGEGGGKVTDAVPFTDKFTAYQADLALIQLGENDRNVTAAGFQQPYEKLLAAIRAGNRNARILCSGIWGVVPTGDHTKDAIIRDACLKYGATFADLGGVCADPANCAGSEHLYTNVGVNWHPSDAGMAVYADAFWRALTGSTVAATDSTPGTNPPAPAADPAPAATATSPAGPQVELNETWTNPPSLTWIPSAPPIVQEDGKNVAKISSDVVIEKRFSVRLEVSQFAGREVTIHTRIKSDSIAPITAWSGVEVRLRIQDAEGKVDRPNYSFSDSTFGWKNVTWKVQIPTNAVSVYFTIGLEKVSGTVWYDAIQISAGN